MSSSAASPTASKTNAVDPSAFGRYAPTGFCAAAIGVTRRCSQGWLAKRLAFFLRAMGIKLLRGRPVDVETLGARMRLRPHNNVAEKRLLFTPQYFDARERALIASRMSRDGRNSGDDFVFIDAGASVGGYALSLAAAAPRARILAIEPLPEIFERLVYNIDQNAFANVKALSLALADRDGEVTLFVNAGNRGETSLRVVSADVPLRLRAPAKSLLSVLRGEGYARLDAIKLDIEGAEDLVLDAFFRDAPRSLWPRLIVMEFNLLPAEAGLEERLRGLGYREILRTVENVAYEREAEAA
ncbi:MAG TPA: FkbM family methyltransferase [Roseiarcus sp.]|jgi:FkbM family methyltransferase|nr:FkbM family methyltransferase [Roseiarcus sp.]